MTPVLCSAPQPPFVTVILPIRNEAHFIERSLGAVLAQDYPHNRLEVLVVDGMSDDGTRELIRKMIANPPAPPCGKPPMAGGTASISAYRTPLGEGAGKAEIAVKVVDNPARIVPTALNRGIQMARGEVIVRVDGHTVIAPDYVSRCIAALRETGADNVGGLMHASAESRVGQAIALATSSPFGVGGARFHYASEPGWVDTVYLGAYRREVFERIGGFDEELVRNQDDEFNFRLTRAGGKIWLDPQIRSAYSSRATLRALWRQYFEYGFWKVRVIQKHGRPASVRHLMPALFVMALAGGTLLSLVTREPLWLALVVVPYTLGALGASALVAARNGWRYLPVLPLVFWTLHLAYGIGFLVGVARLGANLKLQIANSKL